MSPDTHSRIETESLGQQFLSGRATSRVQVFVAGQIFEFLCRGSAAVSRRGHNRSDCTANRASMLRRQKASEMFFVGVNRRQRLAAGRLLIVMRVIQSPAWHLYPSVDLERRLVAAHPRPVTRLADDAVDLLLARL